MQTQAVSRPPADVPSEPAHFARATLAVAGFRVRLTRRCLSVPSSSGSRSAVPNKTSPALDPIAQQRSAWLGTTLGIVAAVFYTATNIFLRSAADLDSWLVSAIKTFPTVLGAGGFMLWSAWRGQPVLPRPRQLMAVAWAGLFAHFAGNLFFQFSLGVIGIALTVPLSLGTLICGSALLGRMVLLEPLHLRTMVALGTLVVAMTALSQGAHDASETVLRTTTLIPQAESRHPVATPPPGIGQRASTSRSASFEQGETESTSGVQSLAAFPAAGLSQPMDEPISRSVGQPLTQPPNPLVAKSSLIDPRPSKLGSRAPLANAQENASFVHVDRTEQAPDLAGPSPPTLQATLGVLAACTSGFAYALLGMTIRRSVTGQVSVAAAIFTVAWVGLITLVPITTWKLGWDVWIRLTGADWLVMLLAGICNLVAFFALSRALQSSTLVHVNAMNASQVAMASLAGIVIFSEPPSTSLGAGVALTVLGLLAMPRHGGRSSSPPVQRQTPEPAVQAAASASQTSFDA
jgi:drug/metabolite transporter (DMT)-like permease